MKKAIIIGAGFAGSVSARILAQNGYKVYIYEKRPHIGGNCYDEKDKNGILIHKYGPHLFHTSNKKVWDFLSRFTKWQPYEHKVKAHIKGKNVPIPFNFNTIEQLFRQKKTQKLIKLLSKQYELNSKIPILELLKSDDKNIKNLADFIYENMFKNYTAKQWGVSPKKIDKSVSSRVPVFIGRDDRYFNDTYQAVPKHGYTKLFENLLNHKNIKIQLKHNGLKHLKLDKNSIKYKGKKPDIVIYTGAIDELFSYKFGSLSYRSLNLKFQTKNQEYFQECTTLNYPNNHHYTRITEFKHIHQTKTQKTTILKEFPCSHVKGKNIPYYPFFTKEAQKNYKRYQKEAKRYKNLLLLGRLAEYKYYDMDDIVLRSLKALEQL